MRATFGRFRQALEAGAILGIVGALVAVLALRSATAGAAPSAVTVADAWAAQAADPESEATLRVSGYWSNGSVAHSCSAPNETPGDLEIYCHDGEFGISDGPEPLFSLDASGIAVVTSAPHLTPWISASVESAAALFALPEDPTLRFAPSPIVVDGHFADPAADKCRPEARDICTRRFVVDAVVSFEPTSDTLPALSPSVGETRDKGLFDPAVCGDSDDSFIGWTTTKDLGTSTERAGSVFAVVTAEAVLLGGDQWNEDPAGSSHTFRAWGRRICFASTAEPDVILIDLVPGTEQFEWDDGVWTTGDTPAR